MQRIHRFASRVLIFVLLLLLLRVESRSILALADVGLTPKILDATPYLDPSKPDFGIQQAIDDLSAAGGGIVQLPAGTFTLEAYLQLKNGVTLKGQGPTTILTAGRNEQRVTITASYSVYASATIQVADTSLLKVDMVVYVWRSTKLQYKPSSYTIVSIDASAHTITLDKKVSYPLIAGVSQISFGLYTKLTKQLSSGDNSYTLAVADPSVFKVGESLVIVISDTPPNGHHGWGVEENIVTAIDSVQKTLTVRDHIELSANVGTVVSHGYGAIMSEAVPSKNIFVQNIGIEDLAIQGWNKLEQPAFTAFSLGAINLMDCKNASISRVQVSNWHSDGVSIQECSNVQVTDVSATGNRGRGFHPGTLSDHMNFLRIQGVGNRGFAAHGVPGDGFYYCWGNLYVNVTQSEFRDNTDSGIGDLGGGEENDTFVDTHDLVEGNLIEGNGRDGVQISGGGLNASSIIRGNTIRDNGRLIADSAGIYIGASKGFAHKYLIDSNLVESTISPATQLYGIIEVDSSSYDADYNTISNNIVRNHIDANILVHGKNTVVSGNNTDPSSSLPTSTPTAAPTAGPDLTPTPSLPTPVPPTVNAAIALTGSYSDQAVSTHAGETAYQALLVTVGVQVGQAGPFNVAADLVDNDDTIITHAEMTVTLAVGGGNLSLRFPGTEIYASKENGPYRLKNVRISDGSGAPLVDEFDGSYLTAAYDYNSFGSAVLPSVYLPAVFK